MTTIETSSHPADQAYQPLAEDYDRFTAIPEYGDWVRRMVRLAGELPNEDVLDCACGTGKSTVALLEAGLRPYGVDAVAEMLAYARPKLPPTVQLRQAGLEELECLGSFGLVTACNDVVNCLLDDASLVAAFTGVARNLHPQGRFVFDLSTLLTYRTFFAGCEVRERRGTFFVWRGHASPAFEPGGLAQASLEAFRAEDGHWRRMSSQHVQRHHPLDAVERALHGAGLRLLRVQGETPDGSWPARVDESSQPKLLCVAGHPA